MIASQSDIKVLSVKDYIKAPKESGYRSYHMIVTVPIFLSDGAVDTKVEIQIRTVAMDFWASLEHKLRYKQDNNISKKIDMELKACAEVSATLDKRMQKIYNEIYKFD